MIKIFTIKHSKQEGIRCEARRVSKPRCTYMYFEARHGGATKQMVLYGLK